MDRLHKSKMLPISYLAPFISILDTNAQVLSTKRFFKPLILPLALFLLGINHSWGQSFATIGTGTAVSTSTGSDPIDGYFESFRYQVVYTAAELSAAGMPANAVISGLGFSIAGDYAGGNLLGYKINMAHTSAINSASHDATTLTPVKSSFNYNPTITAVGAFDMITFSTNFVWNGTSNILVDICSDGPNPYIGPYGQVRIIAPSTTNGSRFVRVDAAGTQCGIATSATNTTKPQISFAWSASSACSGTPNAGTAAITSSVGCPGNSISLSVSGLSTSTGINLQWQSASASTGPWTNITGATVSAYATSATSTTYYRIVSTCTTSVLSATSSVVSYSVVNPGPCVCNTYPLNFATSTGDEEITNVTIGTLSNTSTCAAAATGLGSILNRYGNYAGIVSGPSVSQASSVSFSLTQTSCGGAYGNFFQVYVDWNQDGDWLDVGEQVYSQGASVTGNQTVTGSFIVPITATLGLTRMRVVNVEDVASTTNYAHDPYTYGETEDYCFTITAAVGCTGTPNTGTVTASSISGCTSGIVNLTTTGFSSGAGINYQWISSSNSSGPWTNIIGATSTTYSFTSTVGTTFYRLVTTCTTSATSNTTNAVSFTGVSCISTNVPATGSNTINCGISTKLYDDGGVSSNYSANNNGYTVLNNTGSGIITISGTYLNIESGYDSLTIYSGAGTTGTVLFSYDGSGTMSTFSSSPGQVLTVQLTSDVGFQGEGFDMNVIYTNYVAPTPTISIAGTPVICAGATTNLTASGAATYTWTGLGSTNPLSVTPSAATVYSVTGSACGINSTPKTYTVTVSPSPSITVNSGAICSGSSFTMAPSGGTTYTYTGGSAVVSPIANATYTVTSSNLAGCIGSAVSTVTVNARPIVSLLAGGVICPGASYTLVANGATTYTYSSGSAVVSPTATTTYSVTGTNTFGCVSSNTATTSVTVTSGPSITVNSGAICPGGSFTMTPTGGTTYTYTGGSAVVNPTSNTTYTVTSANLAGCIGSAVSTVTVNANPSVSASASNTLICVGNSAVLTASTTATSYAWNTGATTMSISVSPTVTTTYTVNVTSSASCSSSAVVTVNVSTCTGIDELVANNVTIYPNPNNGIINITLSSELSKNSTLEIYDAIGKLIVTEVLSNELNTLNISNLSNGIYSFRVLNNNNMVKYGKLVKQ